MLLVLKLDQYGYRSNCFQMKKKSLRRFCNCIYIYIHNICTHKIQTLKILINMNYVIDSLAKNNCTIAYLSTVVVTESSISYTDRLAAGLTFILY